MLKARQEMEPFSSRETEVYPKNDLYTPGICESSSIEGEPFLWFKLAKDLWK